VVCMLQVVPMLAQTISWHEYYELNSRYSSRSLSQASRRVRDRGKRKNVKSADPEQSHAFFPRACTLDLLLPSQSFRSAMCASNWQGRMYTSLGLSYTQTHRHHKQSFKSLHPLHIHVHPWLTVECDKASSPSFLEVVKV